MRPIYENTVIQIEITNACELACRHCTRHVGHHKNSFFMEPAFFEKAVKSVLESPCRIGIMGGSPTLHPKFSEILAIYRDLVPLERRELWVTDFKWGEYREEMKKTFLAKRIHVNNHVSYDGKHAPLLVSIDDVVDDEELKQQLIENCPYQSHWSASITPKGGFFCEIAASLDSLFDGPGGYDISDTRWWDRTPDQFQDQVKEYCGMCSGAIPQPPLPVTNDGRGGRDENKDLMTDSMFKKLCAIGSQKVLKGNYEIWDKKITREDIPEEVRNPREFRSFEAFSPEDIKEHAT